MYQHSSRKPQGYRIATDAEGRIDERDTKQCVHCSKHFEVIKGSGKIRGFCMQCMGVTCGDHACLEHFPFAKRMDLYENGLLPEINSPKEMILPKHKKIIIP